MKRSKFTCNTLDVAALPELMRPKQAAALLNTSDATVRRLARNGTIAARRLGCQWRIAKTPLLEQYGIGLEGREAVV